MSEAPHPAAVFLPLGLFLAITGITVIAPGLGAVVSLLTPTPLILIYLQYGKQVGWLSLGVVIVLLGLLLGPEAAVGFATGYGVLVVLLSESIRFAVPPGRAIGLAALVTALLSGVLIWTALSEQDQTPVQYFEKQLQAGAEHYLKTLEETGASPEEIEFMKGVAEGYTPAMARTFPAILAVGSLLAGVLNYAVTGLLWRRFYPPVFFQNVDLTRWLLPDPVVWGFIVSALMLFLTGGALKLIGLNVFIVMVTLYFFQGLSIALFLLKSKRAHWAITALVLVLVFTQPMFMGLVIGLGLFDVWADFRKIRPKEPPPEDDDEGDEDSI